VIDDCPSDNLCFGDIGPGFAGVEHAVGDMVKTQAHARLMGIRAGHNEQLALVELRIRDRDQ
jgi:hypothetical protein